MKKYSGALVCTGLMAVLAGSGSALAQNSIGLQFVGGGGPGTGRALAASEKAGVPAVAQANWNALSNTTGTVAAVNTDDGKPSGVSVTYSCPATWSSTADSAKDGNNALMTGYLDSGDGSDPTTNPSVTISNIPYSSYDVYIYVNGDEPDEHRQSTYTIGDKSLKLTDSNSFDGTFRQPTATNAIGNYLVFKGLTGGTVKITTAPGDSDGQKRSPINAIQIVKD